MKKMKYILSVCLVILLTIGAGGKVKHTAYTRCPIEVIGYDKKA